jgi:hypothetical protein
MIANLIISAARDGQGYERAVKHRGYVSAAHTYRKIVKPINFRWENPRMNEAAKPKVGTEQAQRIPLGQRSKAQTDNTKLRIVGTDTRVPILDVAAFNSFIG